MNNNLHCYELLDVDVHENKVGTPKSSIYFHPPEADIVHVAIELSNIAIKVR